MMRFVAALSLASCFAVATGGTAWAICAVPGASYRGGAFGADAVTATGCFVPTEAGGAGIATATVPLNAGLSASADLTTHVLTAYSSGLFASAALWDTLTFAGLPVAGGPVTLSLVLSGSVSGGANGSAAIEEGSPGTGYLMVDAYANAAFLSGVPLPPSLTLTFTAQNLAPVTVLALITAEGAGGVADLADPPHFELLLPPEVTVVSASGFFDTAASVPEPASGALLALGAGALLRRARRQPI
jgi:hypothetical protein